LKNRQESQTELLPKVKGTVYERSNHFVCSSIFDQSQNLKRILGWTTQFKMAVVGLAGSLALILLVPSCFSYFYPEEDFYEISRKSSSGVSSEKT